jgi:hypothetical protein
MKITNSALSSLTFFSVAINCFSAYSCNLMTFAELLNPGWMT